MTVDQLILWILFGISCFASVISALNAIRIYKDAKNIMQYPETEYDDVSEGEITLCGTPKKAEQPGCFYLEKNGQSILVYAHTITWKSLSSNSIKTPEQLITDILSHKQEVHVRATATTYKDDIRIEADYLYQKGYGTSTSAIVAYCIPPTFFLLLSCGLLWIVL